MGEVWNIFSCLTQILSIILRIHQLVLVFNDLLGHFVVARSELVILSFLVTLLELLKTIRVDEKVGLDFDGRDSIFLFKYTHIEGHRLLIAMGLGLEECSKLDLEGQATSMMIKSSLVLLCQSSLFGSILGQGYPLTLFLNILVGFHSELSDVQSRDKLLGFVIDGEGFIIHALGIQELCGKPSSQLGST